jgi:hypothetical protein
MQSQIGNFSNTYDEFSEFTKNENLMQNFITDYSDATLILEGSR